MSHFQLTLPSLFERQLSGIKMRLSLTTAPTTFNRSCPPLRALTGLCCEKDLTTVSTHSVNAVYCGPFKIWVLCPSFSFGCFEEVRQKNYNKTEKCQLIFYDGGKEGRYDQWDLWERNSGEVNNILLSDLKSDEWIQASRHFPTVSWRVGIPC